VDEVRQHFGDAVFDTGIPRATRLAEAPSFGKPIIYYDKYSVGRRRVRVSPRICEASPDLIQSRRMKNCSIFPSASINICTWSAPF